ncbi:phage tail family protein [Actinoplanes sp. NPDC026670]|uniref:phage tail family protein n=1 Tax=Actinoplanes sp. NPDC026670 TaxID=3154700 RepID=UPI0033DDDF2F
MSSTDVLNLDDVLNFGTGAQALAGATGLGLPEVSAQWIEGAGDGAVYRGSRLRSRDIDLPIYLAAKDRPRLQELLARLEKMLASGEFAMRWYEDDGTYWSTNVAWQAGGGWTYGLDTTGETDLATVVTLRAGSPYWTYSVSATEVVRNSGSGRGLLNGSLTRMRLSASQAIGTMTLNNDRATAPSYPVWTVQGPGSNFIARSPSGQQLRWTGTLATGERLILDARKGTAVDGTGANRYSQLAPAPKFWPVLPGTTTATASLEGTTTASSISCTWQPRRRAVI